MRLSAIMMGIEFVYSAETAFVSPILLSIGIKHQNMTMVWALSPFIGFFMGPLLGSLSDKCRLSWGRRRPFILILAIGLLIGLTLMPYGKALGELMGDDSFEQHFEQDSSPTYFWAVILTILGTMILDFHADNIQAPSRAYLLEVCIQEQHTRALSIFSLCCGIGGAFGYMTGSVNWESSFLSDFIGNNIRAVFILVTIIFIGCLILTVTSYREVPLKLLESEEMLRPMSKSDPENEPNETTDVSEKSEDPVTLGQYLKSIVLMPNSMKILCLTNYLCWICQLCYVLYFTDFVGEAVFHGNPMAPHDSSDYKLYDEGVRFGCLGMSIYSLSCAIYAHFMEDIIKKFSTKKLFIGGLIFYGTVMGILGLWPTKWGVLIFSTATGVVFATAFSVPFMLVARYHRNDSVRSMEIQKILKIIICSLSF